MVLSPRPPGESSKLSMGGGGGVATSLLLAGVRLRRRDDGVGPCAAVPNALPPLAGVCPSPENDLKLPGVLVFPSFLLVCGVKSKETAGVPLASIAISTD